MLEQRHGIQFTLATHVAGDPSGASENRMPQDALHRRAFSGSSLVH
jgi:hypothetical protein